MLMNWDGVREVLKSTHEYALLDGPPGTGKTFLAASLKNGQSVYSVTITDDTSAPDLLGHFVVSDGGGFKFHYGPATRAWLEGALLVLNEIDRAQGGCEIALHAILDDHSVARLTLTNGETIRPNPSFRVIATMNGNHSDLHPALLDRFGIRLSIDEPSPEALATLSPHVREVCLNWYRNGEYSYTFRQCAAYDRMIIAVGSELAAQAVFGGGWREVNKIMRLAAVED